MKIHDFTVSGEFQDCSNMIKVRQQYELILEEQMREEGKVPVLDMGTQWTTSYASDGDRYTFWLTMYGVYRGKKKAREIIGWDSGLNKWYE